MKLRGILRFELAYQARRAWPWLSFSALVVFAFLFTREALVADALYDDIYINSPFMVAGSTLFTSLIWLLLAAPVAGEAAARDVATGMHPLAYTMPISKADYLWGRFLAAFVLNALIVLGIHVGSLLAVYLPGMHPDAVGPFRPAAYLAVYAFLALPNAFFAVAIQFALATLSGRTMASYLGSVFVFFMAWILGSLILWPRPDLGKMVDPIGITIFFRELAPLWTSIEKKTRLVTLEGTLPWNRLLWFGICLGVLAFTYLRFRFAHRTDRSRRRRWTRPFARLRTGLPAAHAPMPAGFGITGITASTPISVPQVPRTFGFGMGARQTLAVAWDSFRSIAKSWTGLAVLAGIPMLAVLLVVDQMSLNGVPLVPTTARVITELAAPLTAEMTPWIVIPLLIVYYAGELVWRERDAGLGEITDSLPESDWVLILGKFLGLGLLLSVLIALQIAAGMAAQVILGHDELEIGLYVTTLLGLTLPEYLLFAALALAVHVLVNQKYVGHLAAIMAFVVIALARLFGIEHHLLIYGDGPGWSYTEMRGFGPFLGPWAWFKLYWAAWALLLAVMARLFWVRGRESRLAARLRTARRRLTGGTARTAATAAALILALGGFIFYNTNVLNEYLSSSDITELQAGYEQRYKRYERAPQPRMTGTRLHIEIHPERRAVEARGSYSLLNGSDVAIDSIHVSTLPGVEPAALSFDRAASLRLADADRGYRIYALARPLQPGDALRLDFAVRIEPRGFRNEGVDASVVANGSYFTTGNWFPAIGYQRSRELLSARDRRKHGLPVRPVVPSLYDVEARTESAGRMAFEAVLGTDEDQVAVAPGRLRRTWTEGGRRYFHYSTDGSAGTELGSGFFSADYAVHEETWNPPAGSGQAVKIQVFHHPGHTAHLDRMLRSLRASLGYYTEHFGPYQRGYLSVVERPGLGTGMHADAGMITHEEGFVFWAPRSAESFDLPSAIVAHETAHQWTVPYAHVEGAPVMSESLAWYYAMQVMRESYGEAQLQKLRSFMRQPYPYPPIRRGEPLLRGLDPYMSYRWGPFALYALSEYMGEDRVNTALRRLYEKHRSGAPPLATTLDLYRELQAVAPDSLRPLLRDLFEVNTFWQLETERATAVETKAGTWQVRLDVRARKKVYDSAGVETEVPMDEWVEIGVFAPGGNGGELSKPLYVRKHRIRSGAQTIMVTVPGKPDLAGIDPYHLLDWEERDDDDNIEAVK